METKIKMAITVAAALALVAASILIYSPHNLGTPTGQGIAGAQKNETPGLRLIVSFSFDDDYKSHVLAAKEMKNYGYRGTVGVITGFLGSPGLLALGDVKFLQSRGWEIASHSATHKNLIELNSTELEYQLAASKEFLEKNGINATTFVYPSNKLDGNIVAETGRYYALGRASCFGESADEPLLYARPLPWNETVKYCMNSCPGTYAHIIRSIGINEKTYSSAWLRDFIGNASASDKKIWFDLHFHELAENVTKPGLQLDVRDFREILTTLESYSVPVVPIGEAYKRCIP